MRDSKPKWVDEVLAMRRSADEWKEGPQLEFKESREKLTSDLWETYSAFANTEGGVIVLGVSDKGEILGIPNAERQMHDLVNTLNNESKVSLNLCNQPGNIIRVREEGKELVLIRVPAAAVKDKPVYLNGHMEKCYVRQNEGDYECKKADLAQMVRDANTATYSPTVVPGTGMAEIDRETFAQYRNRMRSYKPQHPWVQLDDANLLERLMGSVRNADTGEMELTQEGILMFGSEAAIIRYFPQLQLNYFEYDGSEERNTASRWADRVYNDGTWVPNLYQFFFRVLPRLQQRLKNPFRLKADMTTAQGESPAHVAVREALANAVVHADYMGEGGVCIRQYPDKLLLENPGTLLLPKEVVMRGGMSRCRNMALQSMFMMMGIADRAGTGIDKMKQGWADECLLPPMVNEQRVPARVVWLMPYVGLIRKDAEDRLMQHFGGEKFNPLPSLLRLILMMVADEKMSSHRQIREMLPMIHPADLTRMLVGLVNKGFLVSKGRTIAATYSIAPNVEGVEWIAACGNATGLSTSGGAEQGLFTTLKDGGVPINLPAGGGSLVHEAPWWQKGEWALEPDLLAEIQQFRCRKRGNIEQLENLIVAVCRERWVTLPQLAEIMDRKQEYLRRKCVQPMLRHGLLQKRHVDDTHPMQAYTVPSERKR